MKKLKTKFSKEKFSVGLDIGTQSIKAVKLNFLKEAVQLCGFAIEPVSLDLAAAIGKIKQEVGISCQLNIAVSGPATIIRYVNFPRMNSDELKQALRFEAQKHIPFPLDAINLDGYVLKEDLPDNKMLVLIAAVKKDALSQRLKIIEEAGLSAAVIDIDSISLINAFNFNYPQDELLRNKAVALLNIGGSISNLNIMEAGIPRLSRDIHIAGNNFTQKLMDIFALDFNVAESLKLNPDQDKADKVKAAVESILTNLATEVRISFDYYESQSASSVAKIFLSGGGSKFSGLKEMLSSFLGIEVEYWDPLKLVTFSDKLDPAKTRELSSDLAVAVGLALRV